MMNAVTRAFVAKRPAVPENFAVGLLKIGNATVALPVEDTREVVPCPETLDLLPGTSPYVLGALLLRGVVIPVIDIGTLIGVEKPASGSHAGRIVAVLRNDGNLFGLVADGVGEIVAGKHQDMQPLHITGNGILPSLVTHTLPVDGKVVCILDAERLAALPGLPLVPEHASRKASLVSGFAVPKLLFGIGDMRFGIDAISIEATIPGSGISASPLQSDLCAGVVRHQGRQIPVIDTLFALGFGASYTPQDHWSILIVRFPPHGCVGILISDVHRIHRHFPQDVMDIPFGLAPDPALFSGSIIEPESRADYLLLDIAGLQKESRLRLLANAITVAAPEQTRAAAEHATGRDTVPFLVYSRAGRFASPLTQIKEIVEFPTSFNRVAGGRRGLMGYFCHRDTMVAIYDLSPLADLDMYDTAAPGKLLIVQFRQHLIGIAVNDIHSVESGIIRDVEDNATSRPRTGEDRFMPGTVAEIRKDGKKQIMGYIDFLALFEPQQAAQEEEIPLPDLAVA